MVGACVALSASCWSLNGRFQNLTVTATHSNASFPSFSAQTSVKLFSNGAAKLMPLQRQIGRSIVCEAESKQKADSAAKRARQSEKRRMYNRARKSEIRTRMKKVLEELDIIKKKKDVQPDEILCVEKWIADAYSVIDKAVKVGTLHKNTGARRKSRLARQKKAVEIHHGLYVPTITDSIAA
ncbi:unnamed protein product [Cuscuta campestris]|uniref:Small ribosomal subunit protein bS20c n=1 Tax=Cuscuta campestris TaxID=132261 RepID=A0A484KK54_9ASTE|nr:unnamed protein product [Cuscuta campestris]